MLILISWETDWPVEGLPAGTPQRPGPGSIATNPGASGPPRSRSATRRRSGSWGSPRTLRSGRRSNRSIQIAELAQTLAPLLEDAHDADEVVEVTWPWPGHSYYGTVVEPTEIGVAVFDPGKFG
jgi:hypothetical protein